MRKIVIKLNRKSEQSTLTTDMASSVASKAAATATPSSVADLMRTGDVSEVGFDLLERILPLCTVDQLRHVEKNTKGKDLSPVTDDLWKKFFEKDFGYGRANAVIERTKKVNFAFRWIDMYESKLKEVDEAEHKAAEKMKSQYQKEAARKQSRQIRICEDVVLPKEVPALSSNKGRSSGSNVPRKSSVIMKKAKRDFLNCLEVKNLAAMKRKALQKSCSAQIKKPTITQRTLKPYPW